MTGTEYEKRIKLENLKELRRWQIGLTLLTSILYFFYYFGRYNYSVTIPFIKEEFVLTNAQVGLIATALTAAYAIGQFINGFLIDRYGPRIVMTLGAFLSTIANFFMGIGQSFTHLLSAWFSNGYVQAMGYGSCCKLYTNWIEEGNRGKALGFNEFLQSFASMAVVPIGALIIGIWGWRYVYIFPVLPLLLIAIIFYLIVKNKPADIGINVPWSGNVEPTSKGLFNHAVGAYRMALSDWRMLATYVSYGGSQYARFAIYTWVPLYVFSMSGRNIMEGAIVTAMFAFGGAVGSIIIGYLSDLIHKRYPLITAGMILSAVSLFVFALSPNAPMIILSLLMALCGAGIEAVEVAYFLLPLDILDEDKKATGVGCMNAWGKLFATFQGALFGLMLDLSGFKFAFLITCGIALASAFLVVPIRK